MTLRHLCLAISKTGNDTWYSPLKQLAIEFKMNGDRLIIVINYQITSIAIIIPITIGFFRDYAIPYSQNFLRVKIFAVEPDFLILE